MVGWAKVMGTGLKVYLGMGWLVRLHWLLLVQVLWLGRWLLMVGYGLAR